VVLKIKATLLLVAILCGFSMKFENSDPHAIYLWQICLSCSCKRNLDVTFLSDYDDMMSMSL
jgi:hypothetical protein